MNELIEGFRAAIERWAHRTGQEYDPIFYVMFITGGHRKYKTVGRVNLADVPKERRKSITVGEEMGHWTLDQVVDWLNYLVDSMEMSESFLIVSAVKWIEEEFERLSEDYAKGKRRLRTDLELVEKIANDQNEREAFIARMNEAQKTGATMEGDPVTEADLLVMIEHMRRIQHHL